MGYFGAIYVQEDWKVQVGCGAIAIAPPEHYGSNWFAQDQMDRATREYTRALQLDPEVLARESKTGITAMVGSTEDRAKQQYMIAKIYASMGYVDDCLACLRKAKENGYAGLTNVYKDQEFAAVRQDARLAEIVPPPAPK